MILNYIWIAFFLVTFLVAVVKLIVFQDLSIFPAIVDALLEMAKVGFEISLWLTGVISLWMGIMKIGERGGVIRLFAWLIGPLFKRIFPEIPAGHPAIGSILMNFSANMLGLDNAATPLGLKAMNQLQELNPQKDTATNAQIMFLVLNTSGLTIIPVSVMTIREQMGAADSSDVFLPIILATFFSSMVGLLFTAFRQKIRMWDPILLAYLGGGTLFIFSFIFYLQQMPTDQLQTFSSVTSNFILFSIIIFFIVMAVWNKVNVYEAFIDGAKDGFQTAIKIIPYLIAMLVAIGVFRACGALDLIIEWFATLFSYFGMDTTFTKALPTAFMKPLSGTGARGMMVEIINSEGVDSFAGRLSSIMQGSTETTLYVVVVYFGAVNIKKTRYAVSFGLLADLAGIIAAIIMGYLFFGAQT